MGFMVKSRGRRCFLFLWLFYGSWAAAGSSLDFDWLWQSFYSEVFISSFVCRWVTMISLTRFCSILLTSTFKS